MKMQIKRSTIPILFASILALTALSVPAYAEQRSGSNSGSSTAVSTESDSQSSGDSSEMSSSSEVKIESEHTTTTSSESRSSKGKSKVSASVQEKQDAQRLKVCERHQTVANKITQRIAVRGQHQLDLFTTIAMRVEAFYTKSGATVANYDELVADVNNAKANAQQTVDAIKATTVTLKCDGTDKKGVGAQFKTSLKSETQALKDYRTAVKNLTVAVKSAQTPADTAESTNTEGSQQ